MSAYEDLIISRKYYIAWFEKIKFNFIDVKELEF
jgi:hypothetical protein